MMSRQDAEVGEHLGDIASAEKRPSEALHWYRLAAATLPDPSGVKAKSSPNPNPNPKRKQLEVKMEKAKAAGGKWPEADDRKELQQIRTFQLGPSGGRTGTADYRMLISPTGIKDITINGHTDIPGATEMLRKLKLRDHFPSEEDARLLKNATMVCRSHACEVTF